MRRLLFGFLLVALFTSRIILGLVAYQNKGMTLQPVEAAFVGLSFEELSQKADLIISGRVLDENIITAGTLGGGLENRYCIC